MCELYIATSDVENFLKITKKLHKEENKVRTILLNQLSPNIKNMVKNEESSYDIFKMLGNKFKLEPEFELRKARRKFRLIKCNNLLSYVNKFEETVAEYITLGGKKDNDYFYDVFLENISQPKHQIFKQLYEGNTLDQALEHFRKIGHKEEKSSKSIPGEEIIQINKVNAKKEDTTGLFCKKCGGKEHTQDICVNKF